MNKATRSSRIRFAISIWKRPKLIVLLACLGIVAAGGLGTFRLHQYRTHAMAEKLLAEGNDAFARHDWQTACARLERYLAKHPSDVAALRRYAAAHLRVRPLAASNIRSAIRAYRLLLQIHAGGDQRLDEATLHTTYERLARLYQATANSAELGYLAARCLEQFPDDARATIWSANVLLAQRQPSKARHELEKLIRALELRDETRPEYVEACILLSVIEDQEDTVSSNGDATEWLDRALRYDPRSVAARLRRAALYRERGQSAAAEERRSLLRAAREDVERAEALQPQEPFLRLALSDEWIAVGEFERAAAHIDALQSSDLSRFRDSVLDPDDLRAAWFAQAARLAIASTSFERGARRADETLAALTKPQQRFNVLPQAIMLYASAGQLSKARGALNEYLDLAGQVESTEQLDRQTAVLSAVVALAEDKPYDAIAALSPFASQGESRAGVAKLLAAAYARAGQPSRVIEWLTEHLRATPDDMQAAADLIREHMKQEQWFEALQVGRRSEALHPENTEIRLLRMQAEVALPRGAQVGAGESELQRLEHELLQLRHDQPQRVEVRLLLAQLAERRGEFEAAVKELEDAIAICTDRVPAGLALARLYVRNSRVADAVALYRDLCARDGAIGAPWQAFARLLEREGRHDDARSALESGREAVTSADDKRALLRERAILEILHGKRSVGVDLLTTLAAQDRSDTQVRSLLLDLPEIQQDQDLAAALLREIKDAEGERGVQWRANQAKLWLSRDDWRARADEIEDLLAYCLDADPLWSAPVVLLGRLYENLGNDTAAERLYAARLRSEANDYRVAHSLISLLERQGRFDEARRRLQRLPLETFPREWQDRSIRLAIQTGDYRSAIHELEPRSTGGAPDATDLVMLARLHYMQRRDARTAFEYLDRARALAPDLLAVTATRAAILKEEGRLDDARRLIDRAVEQNKHFDAYWLRARFNQQLGQEELAERDFEALTELSEDGAGHLLLGAFYALTERSQDALATWEEGLARFPDDLRLQRRLVRGLITRDQPNDRERAERMLLALREVLPNDAELPWLLGRLRAVESTDRSVAQARELFEEAVRLDPDFVQASQDLVRVLARMQQYQAAWDLVADAMRRRPDDPAFRLLRAGLALHRGDVPTARSDAERVREAEPDNTVAARILIEIAIREADLDLLVSVRDAVPAAVSAEPDNPTLQVARALLSVLDGDVAQAVAGSAPNVLANVAATFASARALESYATAARALCRALAALPVDVVDAHAKCALLAYRLNDFAGAVAAYEKVLQANPADVNAINNLAWLLAETGDGAAAARALELINDACRLAPENVHVQDTRGFILSEMPGRLNEARAAFRKCVELTESGAPERAKALYKLAQVCFRLEDMEDTRELLVQALLVDRRRRVFTADEKAEISRLLASSASTE